MGIGIAHGDTIEHAEVVCAQIMVGSISGLKRDREIGDTGIAEEEIACLKMEGRAATHTVVAVFILLVDHVWRVVGVAVEVDSGPVAEITDTQLNENAAVGVGPNREQLADFSLQVHTALVDGKGGIQSRASGNLAIFRGDALTEDVDAVALQLVTENEIAIGGENPVRLGLVNETATDGVAHAVVFPQVKGGKMEGIGDLEHRDGDGFLHNVFRLLGLQGQTSEEKQGDKKLTHGILYFI